MTKKMRTALRRVAADRYTGKGFDDISERTARLVADVIVPATLEQDRRDGIRWGCR